MRRLAIVAAVVALVAGLWFATLRASGVMCRACMAEAGRSSCRSARAATREEAEQAAVATACATLTQGVTSTLRCQRSVPLSLVCRGS